MRSMMIWLPLILGIIVNLSLLYAVDKKGKAVPEKELQQVLESFRSANPEVYGGMLLISSPDYFWKSSCGTTFKDGDSLRADDQFFAASVSKMMTATVILKYMEKGLLKPDDPLAQYLPAQLMTGLHEYSGQSYGDKMTIRQCLNHTTGLGDNFNDPNFINLMVQNPEKVWQPEELLDYTKKNLPPFFAPGEKFQYSDTNYNLLGMIIEKVSGKTLSQVFREELFIPLKMKHTYRQYREPARPSIKGREPSHFYYGEMDVAGLVSLSADWGGGGLITTTEDLKLFLRAFADNKLFVKKETKALMCNEVVQWVPGVDYGLGVIHVDFTKLEDPQYGNLYGHIGASTAFMFYWPEKDMVITGCFNQSNTQGKCIEFLMQVQSFFLNTKD